MLDFYQSKLLRVDLTTSTSRVEEIPEEWIRKYVGGKGLLLRYLFDEIPAGLDPWSPENPLIVSTGPFAGTNVSTGSRSVVGGKSPATGTFMDSYVGGAFGTELKFAGYDMLIVQGAAKEPTVLWIKDDVVDFLPAHKYWGMRTFEIEEALRADLDPKMTAISIGPGGENRVPWACISNEHFHKAARGGTGALMGSKNLKAVALRGTGSLSVGDAKAFLDDMYRIHRDYILTEDNLWAYEEGTPILVDLVNDGGCFPTRNYSEGTFELGSNINSESFQKLRVRKRACTQCAIGCRNFHKVEEVQGEGPEYETIAMCGSNCGIGDIAALMRFASACDEWGIDTISTGNVVALAMDMTEKGIHDFGLRFGEAESYVKLPELIATRSGVGAELAMGTKALGEKYHCEEIAFQVKGLELPGYDPRGSFGMSIAYATADRGGCHCRSFPIADEIVSGNEKPDTLVGKAQYNINYQHLYALKFCGILCDFYAIDYNQWAQLFKHVWKRDVSEAEMEQVGERVWNLGRLWNLREGFTRKDDNVPRVMIEESLTSGFSAGKVIGRSVFEESLSEFYRLRGWDREGVPSEEKLQELEIDVRLPHAAAG